MSALIALPLLQSMPIDFDRSGVLLLLAPALWCGRRVIAQSCAQLAGGAPWLRALILALAAAIVASVALAEHPAPAAVTAASWVVLALAGLLAGGLVQAHPGASRWLMVGVALGAAVGTLTVWLLWTLGGKGAMPLYAHHRHLGLHALTGAWATTALLIRPAVPAGVRLMWILAGAIVWGGLLWSGGRGPVLALAAGVLIWLILAARGARRALVLSASAQLAAGLAVSALFWTPRPELGWWNAFQRTAAAGKAGSASALTSTRTDWWPEVIRRGRATPWLGHGPDAYRFLTPKLDGQQPHNLVLQLWLDLGVLGAVLALALLGVVLANSARRAWQRRCGDPDCVWFPLAVSALAIGMLDGAFYHALIFLPASLALGILLVASLGPGAHVVTQQRSAVALVRAISAAAVVVLAVHSWLFYALVVAPPPGTSRAIAPRALRAFPSTTLGLWRWLDAWKTSEPDAELAWTGWAQTHASNPALFHVRAAHLRLARGERDLAAAEVKAALGKAHADARPALRAMLREIEQSPR